MAGSRQKRSDDDLFRDSRMSFGDHLEELRSRMWSALKGLGLCMILGFILDQVGDALGQSWIGVGKPMLAVIQAPVKSQVKAFYEERNKEHKKTLQNITESDDRNNRRTYPLPVLVPKKAFEDAFGLKAVDDSDANIEVVLTVDPGYIYTASVDGENNLDARKYLTTLSVQEAFVVYFKVSLMCGVILACPWLFWQFWQFVGAGMYPHEKKYVTTFLPFSIVLFLLGVFLCQFIVLPGAVRALLAFNKWFGFDPDLRLSEWLGFAIIMPLVFGLSFQTPLVMLFFSRLGVFGWEDYLKKWRIAVLIMAAISAIITPTPDAVSMLYLYVPLIGLYFFGIVVCRYMPNPKRDPREDNPSVFEEIGV